MTIERTRTPACPGCGGTRSSTAESGVPDFKYGVSGLWSFSRCAACGLVYLAEGLADPALGYPAAYSQHRTFGRVELDGRWSPRRDLRRALLRGRGYRQLPRPALPRPLARLALAAPPLRLRAGFSVLLLPEARQEGSLLDIGCGNGRFMAVTSALGWRVTGIEPDERSAELARQRTDAPIHAELTDELFPPASFDVITMNHVLEHVPDPMALLRRCFRITRADGLIGIVVPNWRGLGHRLFRRHWYALEPPRHVVMYEPRTLAEMLERAGFRVDDMRTTSVREWAVAGRKSWQYRTGRGSSAPMLAAWAAASALGNLIARDAGEEIRVWARKP